jgi:PIN domain nuclease of toxin-antitoxin system
MRDEARKAIRETVNDGGTAVVSPFSAWEIGMLSSKGRLTFSQRPEIWFDEFISQEGIVLASLPTAVLIASSFLPGAPPKDPWDRIIAATAREFGYTLVTRDKALLHYADAGFINALEC